MSGKLGLKTEHGKTMSESRIKTMLGEKTKLFIKVPKADACPYAAKFRKNIILWCYCEALEQGTHHKHIL